MSILWRLGQRALRDPAKYHICDAKALELPFWRASSHNYPTVSDNDRTLKVWNEAVLANHA